jgi:hypothetical protein
MSNRQTVSLDLLRTVAHGSISGTYTAVGGPFANMVRLICFTNNTDGDMFFSDDGVNDHLFIAAGSFKLFDLNTNRTHVDQLWVLPQNTQFYVRQSTASTKGAVYIECLWGQ